MRALLLAGVLAVLPAAGRALARPESPGQTSPGGYALAASWTDVGVATRVVSGPDGFVYVLSDRGILRLRPDGTLVHTLVPGTPRPLEIAVDDNGIVYGAGPTYVRRMNADGRPVWTSEVKSDKPSILIPYPVMPHVAALGWDGGANLMLLYDRWRPWFTDFANQALLERRFVANGLPHDGPELLFPANTYWDLDFRGRRAYVLNRTPTELRTKPQVELYDAGGAAPAAPIALPAPTERIAVATDGSVFALSSFRWVYHVAADGTVLDAWDAIGARPGLRSRITDVTVDGDDRVYVADPEQREVRVYTPQPGVVNPPPKPGGSDLACHMLPTKMADPTRLRLGEATQVTLTLGGDCPSVAEQADIVLVVDQSHSMSLEGGAKMAAAKDGVRAFVQIVDTSKHHLGLVAFGSYARLRVGLTQNKQAVLDQVDGLFPLDGTNGGTDIAGGLKAGVDELLGPRARKTTDTRPILVLLTDGQAFNTTRLTTVAAADRARYEDITVFSIGFGTDVDPDLLRLVARSPERYEFAPDGATLRGIYEKLARTISAQFLLKDVTIVDEIPRNMRFRPDLPAAPAPTFDPLAHSLTWRFTQVGFGAPLRMSYWLEPLAVGTWPTNIQAIYDGHDGFDQPQHGPFPIPEVVVWAPTATPTVTDTASATPTASATITASPTPWPTPTWTPLPTLTGTRPPPSATPTQRPSPSATATRTPTRTPAPTDSPTPGPTATRTPSGHTVYTTVLFNDMCFQRYTDTVLVLDASTTMLRRGDDGRVKLDAAKAAARAFMDELLLAPDLAGRHDQVALVWFNDSAAVQQGLTNDRAAMERALDAIQTVEGSRQDLGLLEAHKELVFSAYRVLANNPVIVLLSDGIPNRTSVEEVIRRADAAKRDAISVYSVGFGEDVRDDVLRRIASQPEMYRRSLSNRDVEQIYREIAGEVACR